MWHIHNANRMEVLADELADLLRSQPPSPFAGEPVLVQNRGLGRWLNMALAGRLGAIANLELSLPAAFLWRSIADQSGSAPSGDPLSREQLAWRLFAELPKLQDSAGFGELNHYLAGDPAGRAAWRLSERLADVYDHYLVYRPDWIRDWDAGAEPHDWQAQLWRHIAGSDTHRVRQLDAFFAAATRGRLDVERLPRRITLFGVSSLPPIQLEALHALSTVVDVHIFFLNPSEYYWGDLLSPKQKARRLKRLERPDYENLDALLDTGQPLLASLGRQGQDFLRLLYDYEDGADSLAFDNPEPARQTLLADLQQSFRELDSEPAEGPIDDNGSIRVAVCHGPQRECQALHDTLLELFERHPGLEPRDIVVMAPDIDHYAPYIEGVFADQPPDRTMRWAITDRRSDDAHPLLRLVEELLAIPESRFTRSEVIALLEVPALRRRFGMDDEALTELRRRIDESGARWGLDEDDRSLLDLPDERLNSWPWAEERMLLAYALEPREHELYDGIAPLGPVEGGAAVAVGALSSLLATLRRFRDQMRTPRSLHAWQQLLEALFDGLLAPDPDEEEVLGVVRAALAEVVERAADAGFDGEVSLDLLRAALEEGLRQPVAGNAYLAGAVTFCSFQPMRSIPFRVVCLIGMNEADFPRRAGPPEFDRMARQHRPGDRSHRDGDRYAFLEALLSARDALYISYVGRDIRDDTPRQPSTVVSELLDWLDQRHAPVTGGDDGQRSRTRLSERISVRHPLQPFSALNFREHAPTWSFSHRWADVSRRLCSPATAIESPVLASPLAPVVDEAVAEEVDLGRLLGFYRDPPRAFLQQRMRLYLDDDEADEDEEPFTVGGLVGYQMRDRLFEALEEGAPVASVEAVMLASGQLPHGRAGMQALARIRGEVESLRKRLEPYAGEAMAEIEFELRFDLAQGPLLLTGSIDGLRQERGRVASRPGSMKLASLFEAWIHFLLLVLIAPPGVPRRSIYVARDRFVIFNAEGEGAMRPDEARDQLERLLELRRQGLQRPLPLFPESAWKYVLNGHLSPRANAASGLLNAGKAWLGDGFNSEGERRTRPYARVAGRGCDSPLVDAGGQALLESLLDGMLDSGWFSSGK